MTSPISSRPALFSPLRHREFRCRALAMHSSQRQIAVIAGPSVAGLVLAFAGPALCYAVDAFSWLIMLAALALVRTRLAERGGWRTVSLSALGAGLRFAWRHPVIFPLLIMDFGANIFGTVRALLPVFARDILHVGPEGLGVLYAASAVGSLLGAVGFRFLGRT